MKLVTPGAVTEKANQGLKYLNKSTMALMFFYDHKAEVKYHNIDFLGCKILLPNENVVIATVCTYVYSSMLTYMCTILVYACARVVFNLL